jgi:hypothetical protein
VRQKRERTYEGKGGRTWAKLCHYFNVENLIDRTVWDHMLLLYTKYQDAVISSCLENCYEMLSLYAGPLPDIHHTKTVMQPVQKLQITLSFSYTCTICLQKKSISANITFRDKYIVKATLLLRPFFFRTTSGLILSGILL